MSRALLVLYNDEIRAKATKWIAGAPKDTRVEFKAPKRTLPQNDRMWAMLTDVASQAKHCGRSYEPGQWKILFMHACGREVQFIPALDGTTFIPWGQSSSDLGKEEMSELIEFIFSWGAQHGVVFHEPNDDAAEADKQIAAEAGGG